MACADIPALTCFDENIKSTVVSLIANLPFCVWLSFSANHRRAGHAVTNILAKELMQEDSPSSSHSLNKKKKSEEKEEPELEGAESLEELLDAAPSRSS